MPASRSTKRSRSGSQRPPASASAENAQNAAPDRVTRPRSANAGGGAAAGTGGATAGRGGAAAGRGAAAAGRGAAAAGRGGAGGRGNQLQPTLNNDDEDDYSSVGTQSSDGIFGPGQRPAAIVMTFDVATNNGNLFNATERAYNSQAEGMAPLNQVVIVKSPGVVVSTDELAVLYAENDGQLKTFMAFQIVQEANGTTTLYKHAVVPKNTPAPSVISRPADSVLFVMQKANILAFLQSNPHDLFAPNISLSQSSSSALQPSGLSADTTSLNNKMNDAALKNTSKQLLASKGAFSQSNLQPISIDPSAALLTGTPQVIAMIRQFPTNHASAIPSAAAITTPNSIINIHAEDISNVSTTFLFQPEKVFPLQCVASSEVAKRAVSTNNTAAILHLPIQWKREDVMLTLLNCVAVLHTVLRFKPIVIDAFVKRLSSINEALIRRLNLVTPGSQVFVKICELVFESFTNGLDNLHNSIISGHATEDSICKDIETFADMDDPSSYLYFHINQAMITSFARLPKRLPVQDKDLAKDKPRKDKKPKLGKELCLFHYADHSKGCKKASDLQFCSRRSESHP